MFWILPWLFWAHQTHVLNTTCSFYPKWRDPFYHYVACHSFQFRAPFTSFHRVDDSRKWKRMMLHWNKPQSCCGTPQVSFLLRFHYHDLMRGFRISLVSMDQPQERATGYLHYRQFFTIWDSLDHVEYQSLMNWDTRTAWLSDYKEFTKQAYDAIVKLLTSGWMMRT
jgi:hypothetical protein